MAVSGDISNCGILLKKLCSHVSQIQDESLKNHFLFAVNILSDVSSVYCESFSTVVDKIKRKLVREKRIEDAARFSGLINKLQRSNILVNKASVLTLFLSLSGNSYINDQRKLKICSSNLHNSIPNGHADELFSIPPLHDCSVANSRDIGKTEVCANKENTEVKKKEHQEVRSSFTPVNVEYRDGCANEKHSLSSLQYDRAWKIDGQTEVTEDFLLRDVLFVFQGIEGSIFTLDIDKECYKIDPKVRLSASKKELLLKLCEVGWLYRQIKMFCEMHGKPASGRHISGEGFGLINQSLVFALKEELREYCRLIAVLEAQLHERKSDTPLEDSSDGLTLRRLELWMLEPHTRLHVLALLTHAAGGVRGGAAITAIYNLMHHGDPSHILVVKRALSQACTPLYVMLTQWLLDGNLEDPHHEFFIAADPTVSDEKLWHDKYAIRWCMLPSFIKTSEAQKVLSAGKSLNFLKSVCNYKSPIAGRDAIKKALYETSVESMFSQDENGHLDYLVDLCYRETSSHVLEELLNRHKLLDHLRALRRYLLLGQGDFIHYLMEILEGELCKPAANLYPHNLSSLLETAVAASNAQYEDTDILRRLDVRLLETSPGDTGWDVFSLDYHVDGPIGTVFTVESIKKYLMMFNALWRSKHMEWILCATWKQQAATSKLCRNIAELESVLHGIQLLLTEMIHLIQQMAYYMTFEVLECSWHDLMTRLKTAQSLDHIIIAHNEFLKRIIAGALLDDESEEVRSRLRSLYDYMKRLDGLQERLHNAGITEVNLSRTAKEEIQACTDPKIRAELGRTERKRREEFNSSSVSKIRTELNILTKTYQDMVQSFLLLLTEHEDENLHLLSTRLDFNEHYHRKDRRLNFQRTYQHKRKSMGSSLCQ